MVFYENTDSNEVIKLLGQSISTDIKQKHLKKKDVAQAACITEVTLHRICVGENVKLESVIKVLQVINRTSTLTALINPLPVEPMSLYPQMVKERNLRLKQHKNNELYLSTEKNNHVKAQTIVTPQDIKTLFE